MPPRSLSVTLLTLWAIIACGGEANDPSPDPGIPTPIVIGDTITVSVDSGTQGRLFTFRSDSAVDVAVFVQTLSGYGAAILKDSTTGAWLGVAASLQDPDPLHLLFNRSEVVHLSAGTAYLVQAVSAVLPPDDARIRFHLRTVNRQPEILAPGLALGDTVTGETLENTADIDEFTLPVTANQEIIAFLKTASGATQALDLQVQVYPPGATDPIGERGGADPQQDIESGATGVLLMPATGIARIVVRGTGRSITSPNQLIGSYELLVRRVNRAPESIGVVIAVNDTVEGERIDHKGDIDEFTAQVAAGEAYRVFLQTVDAAAGVSLRAELPHPDKYAISSPDDTALADQRSSAYLAPATGPITVQVRGDASIGLDRGGYRLFLYHINRLPETAPATIAPGDSVLNETVEFPGDVDSFTVTAGPTGLVNYVARHPGAGGPISVILTWPTVTQFPGRVGCGAGPGSTPRDCGGGTHAVLPGGEPLKVVDDQDGYGAYQLRTFAIDTAPEGTPPAIPLGQPVSGEITPAGDADVYTYQVGPDELYDLEFDCSCHDLLFNFMRGDQAWWMEGNVAPNSRTGRFAPEAGTYALRVRGAYYGERLDELGGYQFTLRQVPVTPETAGAGLIVPDTVSTESIDSLGDVDQFIVSGPPGREVLVTLPQPFLRLEALEMGSTDTLRTAANGTPGPIVMPAGGQFRLRVFEQRLGVASITDAFLFTGPYFLVLRQLNRAPEVTGPALTRGVEESNEDIGYIGDIDEFTFDGVAGDTTVVRTTLLISPGALRLRTEFLSPTGAVLASVTDQSGTQTFTPPVELPVTGTYRIRIRNTPDYAGTGRYIVEVQ